MARTKLSPKPGWVTNKLAHKDYRNLLCPCDSYKKVKKCCGEMANIKLEDEDIMIELVSKIELENAYALKEKRGK